MDIKEPILNTMLKSSMKYDSQRQEVLARNIANIDTPGYKAMDLKKLDFKKMAEANAGQLQMAVTAPTHQNGTLAGANGGFRAEKDRDTFETTPTQNNVVLQDQMAKVSDVGASFQISSTMLKKYTSMYRAAAGNH